MAKFSILPFLSRKATVPNTVNYESGRAFIQTAELELVSIMLTTFLEDEFYRTEKQTTARIRELIGKVTIRAKDQVARFNTLGNRPQKSTREPGSNLGFIRMFRQVDRDIVFIKLTPIVSELVRQIFSNSKVGPNESTRKASVSVDTLLAQHYSVIVFHS